MKFKVAIFISIIVFLFSFTARNNSVIDINNIDQDKLENLILNKVNQLRLEKRKPTLGKNKILVKAANNQALFLKKNKKLAHNQKFSKTKTPMKRTEFYGGNFSYVGENIAYTYLFERVRGALNKRKTIVLRSYEETAEYFFLLWKNSKSHYKNMIDEDYNLSQIRFSFDARTNRIYGVQIFGAL